MSDTMKYVYRPAVIVKVPTPWDYVKTMLGPAETAA